MCCKNENSKFQKYKVFLTTSFFIALFSILSLTISVQTAQATCQGAGCHGCNTDACAICGDGILGPGEQCDDGNTDTEVCPRGVEGCTVCAANCRREPGDTSLCGDGIVDDGFEQCDDGNTNNNDACKNDCSAAFCGDGVTGPGEQCDDGNATDGDSCHNDCTLLEESPQADADVDGIPSPEAQVAGKADNADEAGASSGCALVMDSPYTVNAFGVAGALLATMGLLRIRRKL